MAVMDILVFLFHHACLHSTLIQWEKDRLGGLKFMRQEIIIMDTCQSFNHEFFIFVHPNKSANMAVFHLCPHLLLDQIISYLVVIK